MFELGAGFGRWTARGAAAACQNGLPYKLVAVEAEPTRFGWVTQNLRDNGVNLADCRVVHAAVTAVDGKVGFQLADPARSYGESIGNGTEVEAISLTTLLGGPFDHVDLVDIDVQGAELDVLENATKSLIEKVKRVHVETHTELLHGGISKLFRRLRWKPHFLCWCYTADKTPWGRINFTGGVQSWLNPRLCSSAELRQARTIQTPLVCAA